MENGYSVVWTYHALQELKETITYLEENFSDKELNALAKEIEATIQLIKLNPRLYPSLHNVHVRKIVIMKFNTL